MPFCNNCSRITAASPPTRTVTAQLAPPPLSGFCSLDCQWSYKFRAAAVMQVPKRGLAAETSTSAKAATPESEVDGNAMWQLHLDGMFRCFRDEVDC
mmetsp:Transcript_10300/g.25892  ORF Transcript_10300/g.25892 Transcript_10300/m.25892 type:complete len:97 (-) Transcript_10300:117-407(-)